MSANNFVSVFCSYDTLGRPVRWHVAEGTMPEIESPSNEESWKKDIIASDLGFPTRISALMAAHDLAKEIDIVEYGVIELDSQ